MGIKFVWNSLSFNQAGDLQIFDMLFEAIRGIASIPTETEGAKLYYAGPERLLNRPSPQNTPHKIS
jgi:hypothetical protein